MTRLLDTTVMIDVLRGDPGAVTYLDGALASGERITGATISRTEVLAGLRPPEEPTTMRFLETIEWIPLTTEIADRAGELARRFLRSHGGIDLAGYVIAATAESLGVEPATRNVKHFPMFKGLRAPY